ncbi:MAG TPA: outer membrane beta-barrel protein [Opitutaceae bacterium]|jgi:hypothetical protein
MQYLPRAKNSDVIRTLNALLIAAITFSALPTRSYAFYKPEVDGDSELFATFNASVADNDNIFLSHNGTQNALIFDFIPGLSFVSGKDTSVTQTNFSIGEDFQKYADGATFSKALTDASLMTRYDDDKTKMSFNGTFNQLDQPEVGLQNLNYLEERNVTDLNASGEVALTDKSSVGGSLIYNDTSYRDNGFTDWSYFEVPVNYYWKVEPKLDLSAGFRYRDNTVGTGGIDSQNYYYNVGARGEFAPDFTGEFDIGYNQLSLDGHGNQSALGMDSKFTYAYSPKTTFTLSLNDDYGYSALGGGGYREPNAYIEANTALNEQWSVFGQVTYGQYQYITTTQRDDFTSFRIGVGYIVSTNVSLKLAYDYANDSSSVTVDSFASNIVTLSAAFRF